MAKTVFGIFIQSLGGNGKGLCSAPARKTMLNTLLDLLRKNKCRGLSSVRSKERLGRTQSVGILFYFFQRKIGGRRSSGEDSDWLQVFSSILSTEGLEGQEGVVRILIGFFQECRRLCSLVPFPFLLQNIWEAFLGLLLQAGISWPFPKCGGSSKWGGPAVAPAT